MAIAGFLESYVFGPLGFWTMAPLRYAAKFDPFLSLDCAPTPSTLVQSKERKGSNFAIWQHCEMLPKLRALQTHVRVRRRRRGVGQCRWQLRLGPHAPLQDGGGKRLRLLHRCRCQTTALGRDTSFRPLLLIGLDRIYVLRLNLVEDYKN